MEERKEGSVMGELLEQGRRLARREWERTRKDLQEDAKETAKSSLLLGASAWMGMTGLSALVVAMAMAVPRRPVRGTVLLGVGMLGGSLALGLLGLRTVPRQPLGRTREGLKEGAKAVKESLS